MDLPLGYPLHPAGRLPKQQSGEEERGEQAGQVVAHCEDTLCDQHPLQPTREGPSGQGGQTGEKTVY